jgi:predicted  nucleic acid-binding Zn-ribbon protein
MLHGDPRALQSFKDSLLADVRRIIDARFQGGTESLDPDSKTAVQQLNVALAGVRAEVQRLGGTVGTLDQTSTELRDQIQRVKSTVEDPSPAANLQKVRTDLERFTQRYESEQAVVIARETQDSLAKMILRINEIEAALGTKKGAVATRGATSSSAQTSNGQTTVPITELEAQKLAAGIVSLRDEIRAIQKSQSALQQSIPAPYDDRSILDRIRDLDGRLSSLASSVQGGAFQSNSQPIQQQTQQPTQDLSGLVTKVATSEAMIGGIQAQITQLKDEIVALQAVATQATAALGQNNAVQLGAQQAQASDIAALNTRLDQIELRLKALVDADAALNSNMSILAGAAAARVDLQSLSSRLDAVEQKIQQNAIQQPLLAGPVVQAQQPVNQPVAAPPPVQQQTTQNTVQGLFGNAQ